MWRGIRNIRWAAVAAVAVAAAALQDEEDDNDNIMNDKEEESSENGAAVGRKREKMIPIIIQDGSVGSCWRCRRLMRSDGSSRGFVLSQPYTII
jgi:hypothetical protein